MKSVDTPVLLIEFNRPDTTQIVFDAIKNANPKKLYLAVDVPRAENVNDDKEVSKENIFLCRLIGKVKYINFESSIN